MTTPTAPPPDDDLTPEELRRSGGWKFPEDAEPGALTRSVEATARLARRELRTGVEAAAQILTDAAGRVFELAGVLEDEQTPRAYRQYMDALHDWADLRAEHGVDRTG